MVFRADRGHRGADPYLTWKVRLFAIGATLGLAGIFLDIKALVWAAIAVLVAGFLLRFFPASDPEPEDDARPDDDARPEDDDPS
jgi:hypothetical protein